MKNVFKALALTSLISANAFAQTATTTGSLEEAKKAAAPKWSASVMNWSIAPVNDGYSKSIVDSINFAAVGYKTSETGKVTLRQWFNLRGPVGRLNEANEGLPSLQQKKAAELDVISIEYSDRIGNIGSNTITSMARVILPTGEGMTTTTLGQKDFYSSAVNVGLRADVTVPYAINSKWSLDYVLSPRVTSYRGAGVPSRNRLVQAATLYYNLSDKLQLSQQFFGFDTHWSDASGTPKLSETLELETGLNFAVNKNLNIFASVSNSTDVVVAAGDPYLYQADNNSYNLITTVNF